MAGSNSFIYILNLYLMCRIKQSQCDESVCSKLLYDQKVLKKITRVEVKMETLTGDIKNTVNEVRNEMKTAKEQVVKKVQELDREKEDLKLEFERLKEELTKHITVKSNDMLAVSKERDAKIVRILMDLRQLLNTTKQDDTDTNGCRDSTTERHGPVRTECSSLGELENGKVFYTDGTVCPKVATFLCNSGFHLIGDVTRTCQTDGEWDNATPRCDSTIPVDCVDVLERGIGTTSGVYTVQLRKSNRTIDVTCDMTTDGGGWTVFQYRFSGAVDFYRTFAEYESGFGRLQGEFWLGLKNIYEMTVLTRSEVYLEFTDNGGDIAIERFNEFHLSTGPGYELNLGLLIVMNDSTSGGNDFSYNNRQKLSTKDKDRDSYSGECAKLLHGGWWYKSCSAMNPNGHYATPGSQSSYDNGWGGMINSAWKKMISLKSTRLLFRRIS